MQILEEMFGEKETKIYAVFSNFQWSFCEMMKFS